MINDLKKKVLQANLAIVQHGLVVFTWGNVSAIDREQGLVVIKPSGVPYDKMKPSDMVVVDMDGKIVSGKLKPSSDLPTHLVLYKAFGQIGSVVHTHSEWATSWAQACKPIPPYGTTHADYFHGEIPCTRPLSESEVLGDYETETGNIIAERFKDIDPLAVPGILVASHAPFAWGDTTEKAIHNAVVLEEVAKMAFRTNVLGHHKSVDQFLLNKHFYRKHGKNAYYGQK
ncbi:MAG: L-ribulose-5-phosphate 4-epimerase [Bacteroidales bacterium]